MIKKCLENPDAPSSRLSIVTTMKLSTQFILVTMSSDKSWTIEPINQTQCQQQQQIQSTESDPYGPFTGQIMSTVKDGCRKAFQAQPQRLMAAMYSCTIQVTSEALGKFLISNLNCLQFTLII